MPVSIYSRFDVTKVVYIYPGADDLQGANLQRTNLRYANLQGANLLGASLQDADLRYANLLGAYLQDADLQDADLQGAYLQDAILQGAYLLDANLLGAYLQDALLRETKLGARGEVKNIYRSDGFQFRLIDCVDTHWRVMAGCRWFTLPEARAHWEATRGGTSLGDETLDIITLFERHAARLDAK